MQFTTEVEYEKKLVKMIKDWMKEVEWKRSIRKIFDIGFFSLKMEQRETEENRTIRKKWRERGR